MNSRAAILSTVGVAAIMLVISMVIVSASFAGSSVTATQTKIALSSTSTSTASTSTLSTATIIILPKGAIFQVQSSYDCMAAHFAQPFNATTISHIEGGISATQPGVTVYISTVHEAQKIISGHPAEWIYSSGLTNSTSFRVLLDQGSYVLWTEGADLGCGATIVMPLELLTTVTVTQAIFLTPAATTT